MPPPRARCHGCGIMPEDVREGANVRIGVRARSKTRVSGNVRHFLLSCAWYEISQLDKGGAVDRTMVECPEADADLLVLHGEGGVGG